MQIFFYGGLIADIVGAALCFLAARWFEMLSAEEAVFLQKCWQDNEHCRAVPIEPSETPNIDQWVSYAIKMALAAVWLGFVFFIAGLLCLVWATVPRATQILVTVFFVFLAAFIPPFVIPHKRRSVLSRLRMKRVSGPS